MNQAARRAPSAERMAAVFLRLILRLRLHRHVEVKQVRASSVQESSALLSSF